MSLLSSALVGVKWSSISQFGRQVVQMITTVVLARTLVPSDFGLMGMAMVVIGFLNIFRDLGTSSAIIQSKEISDTLLSSIFFVNVAFGCFVMAGVFLIAPYVAAFYNEMRLILVLKVLSASFLVSSIGISHQALLERNLQFNKLAKAEIFSTLVGAIVGITLAVEGAGVWSLVFQALSTAILSSVLLSMFMSTWRPRFMFDFREIRTVARFSLNLSGFNLMNYFVRNADALLIGRFLGAQELGYYTLAYRIMLYPLQNVTAVISRVMFPVFSTIRDDKKKFRNAYLKVTGMIALITFPMMLGIMGVSNSFVAVVFGEKWKMVGALLIIYGPLGLIQSIEATTGSIYLAQNRPDWMFRWGLFTAVVAVVAYVIGLHWGIIGVASSCLIATLVCTYPGFLIPFKLIDMKVGEMLKSVRAPLLCSLLMLFSLYTVRLVLPSIIGKELQLSILFLVGIASYSIASLVFNRIQIAEVFGWLQESFS